MKDRTSTGARARWPFWAALALLWTLPWTVMGIQDVMSETIVGQQGVGAGLSAHAIFQLVFVAAYTGVRWLAGLVTLAAVALIVEWPLARRRASA